jgi:competence protein ComEA
MVLIAGVVLVTLLRAVQANSAPAITLHEAPAPPIASSAQSSTQSSPPASLPARAQTSALSLPPPDSAPSAATPDTTASAAVVAVHVVGAVRHPGVYRLSQGARNEDALKAAGGPTATANPAGVNLAARVEDGTQLYIPTHREHPEDHADTTPTAPPASNLPTTAAGGKKGAKSAHSGSKPAGKTEKLTTPGQGQINLNTASASELQRIPGIGPAMAERLIAYRQQNGAFHSVEDLLQVSGIGEKKFARIQPFVRVR